MREQVRAIRGMNDLLPEQTVWWQYLESCLRQLLVAYGYQEIRFPVLEKTALFCRSIGEVTDIVEKEMYTFSDRNDVQLTLRPEGTAGCVRAAIEHGLLHNQTQRLWYLGPMFRYERPQKGRYRQFYQLGVEAFGFPGSDIEIEHLLLMARLWKVLGLSDKISLQINSLGTPQSREKYRKKLVSYFEANLEQLDEDSQRRLTLNPLRLLDSKNPAMQKLIEAAPTLLDSLDEDSKKSFDTLCQRLEQVGINYQINTRLVRGLDYYGGTVYEWVTDQLGAQGAVCAGGRYDGLVEKLGGKPSSAVGFAMGLERIILLLQDHVEFSPKTTDIYIISSTDLAQQKGLILAETLRDRFTELQIINHCGNASLKSQFKKADKLGAKLALVLGENELQKNKISVRFLQENKTQQEVEHSKIEEIIKNYFQEK